jgi:hypothetical protein
MEAHADGRRRVQRVVQRRSRWGTGRGGRCWWCSPTAAARPAAVCVDDIQHLRRQPRPHRVQRAQPVEQLGVLRRRQHARQRLVAVVVGVDQARDHDLRRSPRRRGAVRGPGPPRDAVAATAPPAISRRVASIPAGRSTSSVLAVAREQAAALSLHRCRRSLRRRRRRHRPSRPACARWPRSAPGEGRFWTVRPAKSSRVGMGHLRGERGGRSVCLGGLGGLDRRPVRHRARR